MNTTPKNSLWLSLGPLTVCGNVADRLILYRLSELIWLSGRLLFKGGSSSRWDKGGTLTKAPLRDPRTAPNGARTLTRFGLYLEGCWELSELPLLFSIPFMVYKKVVASLSTFWAVGSKYYWHLFFSKKRERQENFVFIGWNVIRNDTTSKNSIKGLEKSSDSSLNSQ